MEQGTKLLDRVRFVIRTKHFSIRTEEAYVKWIRRYILFHQKQHPSLLGKAHVEAYLTHLAVKRLISASTQNQALAAILFLYREVLNVELPWLDNVIRAKPSQRLPVVLSTDEVKRLLAHVSGTPWLILSLLYGTGMRQLEVFRLRVKDIDFARHEILVREAIARHGSAKRLGVRLLAARIGAQISEHG
jgi:site-specific recombinase XerD